MVDYDNNLSYKVLINFNEELIKNTETFKKLKHSPVIEVENDLYKIDLNTEPDILLNVISRNVKTGLQAASREFYHSLVGESIVPNGKKITLKCHFIANKIQGDIIREAKAIYNNKLDN